MQPNVNTEEKEKVKWLSYNESTAWSRLKCDFGGIFTGLSPITYVFTVERFDFKEGYAKNTPTQHNSANGS